MLDFLLDVSALSLTWHCEVLSIYDLIISIVELVVVLLCVSVQILKVGHHCHTPPRIPALCTGRDGYRGLRWGVFLTHPAGMDGQTTGQSEASHVLTYWSRVIVNSHTCVALCSVWRTSLQGHTRAFLKKKKKRSQRLNKKQHSWRIPPLLFPFC